MSNPAYGCLLLVFLGACAAKTPAPVSGDVTTSQQSTAAGRNRDLITNDELAAPGMRALNVYEVVRQLRPHFLNVRGMQSTTNPEAGRVHASLDGTRIITVDELRNILAANVTEIRYLNAAAAMQKFGTAALEGPVIVVKTSM